MNVNHCHAKTEVRIEFSATLNGVLKVQHKTCVQVVATYGTRPYSVRLQPLPSALRSRNVASLLNKALTFLITFLECANVSELKLIS